MIKAVCPKDAKHKRFTTTAHVMQEWEVDERGEYQSVTEECMQVTHSPDVDNIWVCKECGSEAIVTNE